MNAIDIIKEAAKTWPVTFPNSVKARAVEDRSYGLTHREGQIKDAIMRRADSIEAAVKAIETEDWDALQVNMSGAIPALAVACQMLCLSREQRLEATFLTWGE